MATRVVTINFNTEDCDPIPSGGFKITYREQGSVGPYIDGGTFPGSPAIVIIEDAPDCAQYEGFLQSVCDFGILGALIPWATVPCVPVPPAEVDIVANIDGTVTVTLPVVGNYHVKIIEQTGEDDCESVPAEEFDITDDDEGTSGVLPNGTYFACVASTCDNGCVVSAYVSSPEVEVSAATCRIYQNTDVVNATNVSWTDCNGNPHGPMDITPGSNFCADPGSVTGPDEGSLTDMGPCVAMESENFDLANNPTDVCNAPVGMILWYTPPFVVGTILYTDSTGTTNITGYSLVRYGAAPDIYNLNVSTGQVGAVSGSC